MKLRFIDLSSPDLSGSDRYRLCLVFYDLIYKQAFPIADEAEDPSIWLSLLTENPPSPKPELHIVLAVAETDGEEEVVRSSILGGLIYEFYRASEAMLITYLCVAPDTRRKGIAKSLLRRAVDDLKNERGGSIPVFAEAEDPKRREVNSDRLNARIRLTILKHLGFRKIPIRYQQPALAPGKFPVNDLVLLLFTGGQEAGVEPTVLRRFMREFYASLNARLDEPRMFGGRDDDPIPAIPLGESE